MKHGWKRLGSLLLCGALLFSLLSTAMAATIPEPETPHAAGVRGYFLDTDGIEVGGVYIIVSGEGSTDKSATRTLCHMGTGTSTNYYAPTSFSEDGQEVTPDSNQIKKLRWMVEAGADGTYYLKSLMDHNGAALDNPYLGLTGLVNSKATHVVLSVQPVALTITHHEGTGLYTIANPAAGYTLGYPSSGKGFETLATSSLSESSPVKVRLYKETYNEGAEVKGDWQTDLRPDNGITTGQPFAENTAGSRYFRIPAVITLKNQTGANEGKNGRIVSAIDARWTTTKDCSGLDTIVSWSDNGGAQWNYTFPNYMGDSPNEAGSYATCFIDPVLTEGKDGTLYLMTDLFPGGVALAVAPMRPAAASGYVTVGDAKRLALYLTPNTEEQTDDNWVCYVGDFDGEGYAPVLDKDDNSDTGWYVDRYYYLYKKADGTARVPETDKVYCAQTTGYAERAPWPNDSNGIWVQQNVFFYNATLHVRNASYLWLVTSEDGGETWSAPTILNDQIRRDDDGIFYGVGPGAGLCLDDGTILLPTYASNTADNLQQHAGFIYSDNGTTWQRAGSATAGDSHSSESTLVQIGENTVRQFYRNSSNTIWYTDYTRQAGSWTAGTPVDTGVTKTADNQLAALKYSRKIDGKDAIFLSTATGKTRTGGKIYTFLLEDNGSMTLAYEYAVTGERDTYAYSSLTETAEGDLACLYESQPAAATFVVVPIEDVVNGVIGGEQNVTVPLYGSVKLDAGAADAVRAALAADETASRLVDVPAGAELILWGVKQGSAQVKYQWNGTEVTLTLTVAGEPKEVTVEPIKEGDSATVAAPAGSTRPAYNSDPAVVTAIVEPVPDERGAKGTTGSDASYTGDTVYLSGALYTFTGTAADGYTVESAEQAGLYLNPMSGAGYPNSATSVPIKLVESAKEPGSFLLDSADSSGANRGLYFYRNGNNVFDRWGVSVDRAETQFFLYRPVNAGEAGSAELPGYARVTRADEVESGGCYLIVAKVYDSYFVLNPSDSTTDKYAHVLKAALPEAQLTLTGVKKGTAKVIVGDRLYLVSVTKDPDAPDPVVPDTPASPGVTAPAPQVTVREDETGTVTAEITVPAGSGPVAVTVPVSEELLTPGSVLVMVDADGNETVVKKSALDGNGLSAIVDGSCTVKVEDRSGQFDDVSEGSWYADAVDFASARGLFAGVSETEFDPDGAMGRAMLATVLYRLEDAAATGAAPLFQDVTAGAWYADAVSWASAEGIVVGVGNGFEPDRAITRQELATMLYRYAQCVGLKPTAGETGTLAGYRDAGLVSGWAMAAMEWAVDAGLITGRTATTLDPQGTATRAETAMLIQRLIELMVG